MYKLQYCTLCNIFVCGHAYAYKMNVYIWKLANRLSEWVQFQMLCIECVQSLQDNKVCSWSNSERSPCIILLCCLCCWLILCHSLHAITHLQPQENYLLVPVSLNICRRGCVRKQGWWSHKESAD